MEFTTVAVAGSLPQPPPGSSGIADHGAAGHDRGETPVQTGANTRHRTESALLDFRVNLAQESRAPMAGGGAHRPGTGAVWVPSAVSGAAMCRYSPRRAAFVASFVVGSAGASVGRLARPSSVSLSARLDLIDTTLDAAAHKLFKREVHARCTALGSPTKGTGDFGTQNVSRRSRHENTIARARQRSSAPRIFSTPRSTSVSMVRCISTDSAGMISSIRATSSHAPESSTTEASIAESSAVSMPSRYTSYRVLGG